MHLWLSEALVDEDLSLNEALLADLGWNGGEKASLEFKVGFEVSTAHESKTF